MKEKRTLDIVIPVYNEAATLASLFKCLERTFSPEHLNARGLASVRFIFIDDGSQDTTVVLIRDHFTTLPITLLALSRNFGHQAALGCGLDHASADLVAVMDADLQDPPELVLDMVARIDQGYDIVFGQRLSRKEAAYKRFFYWAFYRLCSILSEVPMPVDAGDFCVMTAEVVDCLKTLPEKLRFQRGLRGWIGFRQSALGYDRPRRETGTSKYTWQKLYRLATDGIASLSTRPLRITQPVLFLSSAMTLLYMAIMALSYRHFASENSNVLWFLTTQGLIAFTSSLQLFCLYVMSAYIGRMYLEVKGRPSYIVMRNISSDSVNPHDLRKTITADHS